MRMVDSIAAALATGNEPGRPRHTGQVAELAGIEDHAVEDSIHKGLQGGGGETGEEQMAIGRQPPDARRGEGVALAGAADSERALAGQRQRADTDGLGLVPEAGEHVVAEDEHVVAVGPPGDLFEVLRRDHPAGGVVWRAQHQEARSAQGAGEMVEAQARSPFLDPGGQPADDGAARLLDMGGGFYALPAIGAQMLQGVLEVGVTRTVQQIAARMISCGSWSPTAQISRHRTRSIARRSTGPKGSSLRRIRPNPSLRQLRW